MKKPIQKRSANELGNYPLKKVVRGWFFRVDELSQGYYCVEGVDPWGRTVSREGTNPDELINRCKEDIVEMLGNAFTG